MADYNCGWSLHIANMDDRDENVQLTQGDLDYIANCLKRGFLSGEVEKEGEVDNMDESCQISKEVIKALYELVQYNADQDTNFEQYCKDELDEPFIVEDWDGDIESIPQGARDHIYYHTVVVHNWLNKLQGEE